MSPVPGEQPDRQGAPDSHAEPAEPLRLFVAIYPSPPALADLTAELTRLRVGAAAAAGINVRLTTPETAHVTVVFIGELDPARLPEVELALARAARSAHRPAGPGRPAGGGSAPRLRLGGGGQFGSGGSTVLWVGLRGEIDRLRALSLATRRELTRAGLPYDQQPYAPHLTIARPGERVHRDVVEADRITLDGYLGPSWSATELVLSHSRLGQRGYHRLASWPL